MNSVTEIFSLKESWDTFVTVLREMQMLALALGIGQRPLQSSLVNLIFTFTRGLCATCTNEMFFKVTGSPILSLMDYNIFLFNN